MFSIIFYKVSSLDNVRDRNSLRRGSPCQQLNVSNDRNETVSEIGKH